MQRQTEEKKLKILTLSPHCHLNQNGENKPPSEERLCILPVWFGNPTIYSETRKHQKARTIETRAKISYLKTTSYIGLTFKKNGIETVPK